MVDKNKKETIIATERNGTERNGTERNELIMLGIIDKDGFEEMNRVYYCLGVCPSLRARDYKTPIKVLTK